MARSPHFLVRQRLRGALRGLAQRSHDGAPCQTDLEAVVRVALGPLQQLIRRTRKCSPVGALAAQGGFGCRIPPRLVRDAAKRQPGLLDRIAFEFQRRRYRFRLDDIPPGATPEAGASCLADIVGGVVRAVLLIGQAVDVTITNVKPGRYAFGDTLIGETPRNLYVALQPRSRVALGDTVKVTIGRNTQGPVGLLL